MDDNVQRQIDLISGPIAEREPQEPVRKRIHIIILAPDVDKKDIRSKFPVEIFHIKTPLYVPDFSYDYMEQQHYPDCVTDIRVLYDKIHKSALIFFRWYAQRILGQNWGWILRRRGVDFRFHSSIVDSANPHTMKIQERLRLKYELALEDPKWHVRLDWFLGDETRYRVKSEREYWLQFYSSGKPPPT